MCGKQLNVECVIKSIKRAVRTVKMLKYTNTIYAFGVLAGIVILPYVIKN